MIATRGWYTYDGVTSASSRPPLYAFVIALLMRVTSHPHAALVALQILVGSVTVALAAGLARRTFGPSAALIAGAALALAPMTARFTALGLSETLFTFFIVLSMWWWQDDRPVASGLALGLSTLTRAVSQPFVLFLVLAGVLSRDSATRRRCLTIAAVAVLTTAPWIARNAIAIGQVTLADGSWGTTLAYGSVRLHGGANPYAQIDRELGIPSTRGVGLTSADQRSAVAMFLTRLRNDPMGWVRARVSQYPWLLLDTGGYVPVRANAVPFARALRERTPGPIVLKLSFLAANVLVLAMSVYGVWTGRARVLELLPLWLFPAFVLIAQLPAFVEPRFGLPIMPFVLIFAAAGLAGRPPRCMLDA